MKHAPHPFPLPIRWGEGGRRSGEGWFMVRMRDCEVVEATHEPSSPPVQPFVAYATKGCCRRFLASMRDFEIVGATHEPRDPRCQTQVLKRPPGAEQFSIEDKCQTSKLAST